MGSMLRLRLTEDGADLERLDALTGYLRQELLLLDVDDVIALPIEEVPSGARGVGAVTVGALLIDLGSAAQSLSAVVLAVRDWLTRSGRTHRSVRLELGGDVLELSDASAADQDHLIGLFISHHSTPGQ
jgi:hypothetical protein